MMFPRPFAAFLLISSPAAAQQLGGAASADISLVRVFLALFVCIVLAVLAILLIRHRLGGRSFLPRFAATQTRIRLVESRRISPQAEISLVECDGTQYLMLIASGGSLLLKEQSAPAPANEPHA